MTGFEVTSVNISIADVQVPKAAKAKKAEAEPAEEE